MNKTELLQNVAQKAQELGVKKATKKDADLYTTALWETVAEALSYGDPVTISGVGKFETVVREAHQARNPSTGESVSVPDRVKVKFRVSQKFTDHVLG